MREPPEGWVKVPYANEVQWPAALPAFCTLSHFPCIPDYAATLLHVGHRLVVGHSVRTSTLDSALVWDLTGRLLARVSREAIVALCAAGDEAVYAVASELRLIPVRVRRRRGEPA